MLNDHKFKPPLSLSLRTIYDGLGGLFDLDEAHAEVPNDG